MVSFKYVEYLGCLPQTDLMGEHKIQFKFLATFVNLCSIPAIDMMLGYYKFYDFIHSRFMIYE